MQIDKNESYNLDFNPKLDILKYFLKRKKNVIDCNYRDLIVKQRHELVF